MVADAGLVTVTGDSCRLGQTWCRSELDLFLEEREWRRGASGCLTPWLASYVWWYGRVRVTIVSVAAMSEQSAAAEKVTSGGYTSFGCSWWWRSAGAAAVVEEGEWLGRQHHWTEAHATGCMTEGLWHQWWRPVWLLVAGGNDWSTVAGYEGWLDPFRVFFFFFNT